MKIIDMHCDTIMSHYYNREEHLLDRKGHLNLQMMQKAGASRPVLRHLSDASGNRRKRAVQPV